jgi:hypothetical protein
MNLRKFVSCALFALIISLAATGTSIQVLENFPESIALHSVTAAHVLVGFTFAVISAIHIVLNWRTLKAGIKGKAVFSKEAALALMLATMVIACGAVLGYVVFYT